MISMGARVLFNRFYKLEKDAYLGGNVLFKSDRYPKKGMFKYVKRFCFSPKIAVPDLGEVA